MRILTFTAILIFTVISAWLGGSCNSNKEENEVSKVLDTTAMSSDSSVHIIKVNSVGNLRTVFNDINVVHLSSAMAIGINPINDLSTAYAVNKPLVKINSCKSYYLDTLTYSLPYLIPQAAKLLSEIGDGFSDSIKSRCGKNYKIRVTSVLRTEGYIAKLRCRNKNATDTSAHQFGTTFDISYVKFIACDPKYIISQECLKNVLAEVLFDLRSKQRCYVKYEVHQGCFHITAR
ncbi:MAG: DUF5715 family protein [Muribaculaceae bacterium]